MFYDLCFMFYVLCFMFYVLCFMFYVLCFMFYVLCFMFYVLCFMFYDVRWQDRMGSCLESINSLFTIFTRPGVAGAVLLTPLSLIN